LKYYTVKGQRRSLTQWAALAGITRQAMTARVSKVSSPEELMLALTSSDFQGQSAKVLAIKLTTSEGISAAIKAAYPPSTRSAAAKPAQTKLPAHAK
jgi:hypothetical protein